MAEEKVEVKKNMQKKVSQSFEIILAEGVEEPKYMSEGSIGLDVTANSIIKIYGKEGEVSEEVLKKAKEVFKEDKLIIPPNTRVLFGTGIKVNLPQNLELQVRSRSGLALKQGVIVLNSPGTIDSDYKGEIGIILFNTSNTISTLLIKKGDRIAQLVPKSVIKPKIIVSTFVEPSERGENGFGSTDK